MPADRTHPRDYHGSSVIETDPRYQRIVSRNPRCMFVITSWWSGPAHRHSVLGVLSLSNVRLGSAVWLLSDSLAISGGSGTFSAGLAPQCRRILRGAPSGLRDTLSAESAKRTSRTSGTPVDPGNPPRLR